MSQMKGQDKNLRKTTEWSVDREPSRKIIQNNDSEDDPRSQKKTKDAWNVYQRSRRTKKHTEMNNTLEGINSRITEV